MTSTTPDAVPAANRALLVGEVPSELGPLLEEAGFTLIRARSFDEVDGSIDAEVLVTAAHIPVGAAELDHLPKLKLVARAAAGVDNVDQAEVKRRGLPLVHAPEANAQSAAELTMGLLFCLSRRIPFHNRALHGGEWSRGKELGFELQGRRLGMVGLGRVGSRVARMAGAIPMELGAYDPYLQPSAFQENRCRQFLALSEMLAWCQVLTLHCPLTAETRGLIGAEQLAALPPGALVLNVARGGILDEAALAKLISNGRIDSAGVDCWEQEPTPWAGPLLRLPEARLVASPHCGGRTGEARARVAAETVSAIRKQLSRM